MQATELAKLLQENGLKLVTAESCTGGLLSATLTDVPGSSAWFERGFVTYSNAAKQELLAVPVATLEQFGAVSEETAAAMAAGALKNSQAQVSIAITGIAGPDGGSGDKPVGTVWFGFGLPNGQIEVQQQLFAGDRQAVRIQAVDFSLTATVSRLS